MINNTKTIKKMQTEENKMNQKISDLESIIQKNNSVIDNIPDLLILLDPNCKILLLNEAMAKNLGETKENLIGKNALDLFPPEIAKNRKEMAHKLINTKKPFVFEDKRDGRWFRQKLFPVFDSKGNAIQFLNIVTEITKQKEMELSLERKESEFQDISNKYNLIVEEITDVLMQVSLTGKILYISQSCERISGYKADEVIGKRFTLFAPKKEWSKYFSKLKEIMSSELVTPFETYITHKNGTVVPVEFTGYRSKESKKHFNAVMRDISERKKTENKLKESEEKFRMLSDQSIMGIGIIQGKQIKYANDAVSSITGYAKEEFISKGSKILTNIIHPDDISFVSDQLQKKLSGNKDVVNRYVCRIITKNNNIKWLEIFSKTVNYEGNYADLITFVDITDIKTAEQDIRESEEKYRSIFSSASEIIFTIGSDYKIKTWNKSAKMKTGYKQSHVIGKSISNLKIFGNQDELKDYIQTIFKGKTATLQELTIITSFGSKRIFSVSPSCIMDKTKNVNEILFVCRDITHEKERHGKLLFSESYLISEPTSEKAVEIFAGIIRTGHSGLYICRTSDSKLINIFTDVTPTIVKLSKEKDKKYLTCSNFEELLPIIEEYVSKEKQSIVLLDRIDYLIINSSFEFTIKKLYSLTDMMKKHNCLLLISINPSFLDKTQMAILKEELQIPPEQQIEDVKLEETLFDILDYIQIESRRNILISHSKIGNHFSISKLTTQKRIDMLLEKGLIFSKKQGRKKTLHITNKGKNLLDHRSII